MKKTHKRMRIERKKERKKERKGGRGAEVKTSSPKGNNCSPESHYKSMGTFSMLNLAEIQTYLKYYACHHYLQVKKASDQ